ncbi:hypothetical protein SH528x_001348 [Novipirellula sp. SH528]|uniref:hypothetical protein n=1 Tax=Novipirellula sp. SH528 TaxID=3454466 RepID=UPI003FA01D16
MNNESSQPLPPNGRLISAGMAAAAAIGMLINHYTIGSQNVGRLMILCLGPIAFFLGLGGIFEPKIVWAVGKYGKHLPVIYKLIGGTLGALGVAVTLLLLLFVYRLGPPTPPPATKPATRLTNPAATTANLNLNQPVSSSKSVRRVEPQEVMYLTYARSKKRWEKMDETAAQGVRREVSDGTTTLHYLDGAHSLLKVLWPDVLEVGDRFTVELQGANSIELVDLQGADANARASLPSGDKFVVVEIAREKDGITFIFDGQSQKAFHASGKLRGDEAKAALLATSLRPGFSVKKGSQASFRNATIIKH